MVLRFLVIRFLVFAAFCLSMNFTLADQIRVVGKQAEEDIAHEYFLQLLSLTISASLPAFPVQELEVIDINRTTQGRTLTMLAQGDVDVFWSGTDHKREAKFIPIKVPLFKGLLGYRVAIIHQDNLPLFTQVVQAPEKLKQLTACQGEHWPDSDILVNNGYKVSRIVRYDSMFTMLAFKRCDYFPRAIFEGYSELAIIKKKYPELIMFDQFILHYPFAIYFFVNKDKPELAQQIEYGLEQLLLDGRFMKMMENHPLSAQLFPLTKWHNRLFIHLENPDFPAITRSNQHQLWLKLH